MNQREAIKVLTLAVKRYPDLIRDTECCYSPVGSSKPEFEVHH